MIKDQRVGFGKMTVFENDQLLETYIAHFQNNLLNGLGIFEHKEGTKYEGTF